MHRQVDATQMGTHNICLYREVDKKNTGFNLKTTEFLDCALIEVCAVIRSTTVFVVRFVYLHNGQTPYNKTVLTYCRPF